MTQSQAGHEAVPGSAATTICDWTAQTSPVRVAIADDAALFRAGLAMLLTTVGVEVTAQASSGDELLTMVADDPPDVVVLDIRMPPEPDGGLLTAERLRARHPHVGVLVLSQYAETPYAIRLLEVGTRGVGYRLKDRISDVTTLRDTLARIASGEAVIEPEIVERLVDRRRPSPRDHILGTLTDRERDVLREMAEGRSNTGIAHQLHLTPKTVEKHIASVFAKLGLDAETTSSHRRVLALLSYLRARKDSQAS
jgi:DNA-binding NarL/FixJ family response regulator